MTEPDTASLLVTRIVLERRIGVYGDSISTQFRDGHGDTPSLVEILGMLEVAKATALGAAYDCDCDCEDEP